MFLSYKRFCCQLDKKWGEGPKVQKNQNRGAIMFDFKVGVPKSQILQNRGTKRTVKPKYFYL
jgi:hypothetical protein